MNKTEAIAAMDSGKKVRHNNYFREDEFIYKDNGVITTNYGAERSNFFDGRTHDHWNENWEIFKEVPKPIKAIEYAGDWYIIPNAQAIDFTISWAAIDAAVSDEVRHLLTEDFEKKFGHMRTGGDLNNVQLFV